MRKSFDGLHTLVRDYLELDAFAGHLFVFASRRRDRAKILYWGRDGFAVWSKRLEEGTYAVPFAGGLAAGITRVKSAKSIGVRVGNRLSVQQAQKLLIAPDVSTKKGLRDRAMLAILLGCGLRRSEVAALTLKHIQQRDNRWCIVDLVGKHGRVRTIPMPTWVKVAIDTWTAPAGITEGPGLRRVSRGDQGHDDGMSENLPEVGPKREKIFWRHRCSY